MLISWLYVRVAVDGERARWSKKFLKAETEEKAIEFGRRNFLGGRRDVTSLPPGEFDYAVQVTR